MKRNYQFFVYMMASVSRVLYVGVTNSLFERVRQHKEGVNEGFTKRYHCHKLVYYEEYQYIDGAIAREKQLKKWRRAKKEALIHELNPSWNDLAFEWFVENTDFSAASTSVSPSASVEMTKGSPSHLPSAPVKFID